MAERKSIIDYYYCDEQMAENLGLKGKKQTNLFKCNEDCLNCLACIISINGDKTHVNPKR